MAEATTTLEEPVNNERLQPTMETIIEDCPRFRVLIAGKSGGGKSSLINAIFKVNLATVAEYERGQANIDQEFIYEHNERFVLHDSMGYEAGEEEHIKKIEDFVKRRNEMSLADRLHAIWLCIPIPTHGGRIFEAGDERLLKVLDQSGRSTPVVVVFTMLDELSVLNHRKDANLGGVHARSKAKEHVEMLYKKQNCGRPFVCVSSQPGYEDTLVDLTTLTMEQMKNPGKPSRTGFSFRRMLSINPRPKASEAIAEDVPHDQVLLGTSQRIDSQLKIEMSIAVGRKKYWKNLVSSTFFASHPLQSCFKAIQSDIVLVWNFRGIQLFLLGDEFGGQVSLVVESVGEQKFTARNAVTGVKAGLSTIGAVVGVGAAVAHPAAAITAPLVVAAIIAIWLRGVYKSSPDVLKCLIASIVAFILIMEHLFYLHPSANDGELTPEIALQAVKSYTQSQVRHQVHAEIQVFVAPGIHKLLSRGKDKALNEVVELIEKYRRGGDSFRDWNEHQVATPASSTPSAPNA